jgi:hypothetical protein
VTIVIVDTSILLNILDVPGKNERRDEIRREFASLVKDQRTELLLPLVAVVETGNHIAQLDHGQLRRARGQRLVEIVRQALRGEAPWVLVPFPEREDLEKLLDGLADRLVSSIGFADASMIAIGEREKRRWPKRPVRIWSLDGQLAAYDHRP